MQLYSISQGDLNVICLEAAQSKGFRAWLGRSLQKDPDLLTEQCAAFHVCEDNLGALLKLRGKDARRILCSAVDAADPQSFTDRLMETILGLKNQAVRNSCIISLSHKKLPAAQLIQLCKTNLCFECYFSLVIELYQNSRYTTQMLAQGIAQFMSSPYAVMWPQLYKELMEGAAGSQEKQMYVAQFPV